MNTKFFSLFTKVLVAIVLVTSFAQAGTQVVSAQSSAPLEEMITVQKNGSPVTVKVLKGFDPNEYGGNDSGCTLTDSEPEMVHIGEVVGSPNEACLQVIEWSLKDGDRTIVAGTYALAPREWFYIPLAVSGVNDQVRVVGTLYRMPKGWNAHMMAVFYAIDRDSRDGTHSYIGLSPTDAWVLSQVDGLSGRSDVASNAAATSTVAPVATATTAPATPTAATLASTPTPSVEATVTSNATPISTQVAPVSTSDPRMMAVYQPVVTERGLLWFVIILLILGLAAVAFFAFRRPVEPVEVPPARTDATPRRRTTTPRRTTTRTTRRTTRRS